VKDSLEDSDESETIELGPEDMATTPGKFRLGKLKDSDAPINPAVDSWNMDKNPETEPTANYPPIPKPLPVEEIEDEEERLRLLQNLTAHSPGTRDIDDDSKSAMEEARDDQPLDEEEEVEELDEAPDGGGSRYLILMGALILIGAIVWLVPNPGWQSAPLENTNAEMVGGGQTPAQTLETTTVSFYVPDPSLSGLVTASHPVNLPPVLEKRIQIVLTELFAEKKAANVIFPQGMAVRGVYIHKSTAIISLNGSFRKNYHTGAWTELLAVYSIVNTVVGAFDQVKKVLLLIDDVEVELFVSHMDISGFLYPDKSLVRTVKKPVSKSKRKGGAPNRGKAPSTGGKNG